MARFVLYIDCDNDAFQPDPMPAIANILRSTVVRIEAGDNASAFRTLHDANGNDVGRFKLSTRGVSIQEKSEHG
jgi:hypothetical protein